MSKTKLLPPQLRAQQKFLDPFDAWTAQLETFSYGVAGPSGGPLSLAQWHQLLTTASRLPHLPFDEPVVISRSTAKVLGAMVWWGLRRTFTTEHPEIAWLDGWLREPYPEA